MTDYLALLDCGHKVVIDGYCPKPGDTIECFGADHSTVVTSTIEWVGMTRDDTDR